MISSPQLQRVSDSVVLFIDIIGVVCEQAVCRHGGAQASRSRTTVGEISPSGVGIARTKDRRVRGKEKGGRRTEDGEELLQRFR